jgi:sec-independent protein translocase protein TatB
MFDIGFTELIAVALVALLVIGPERLPKAARTLGHLFGRMQRYVNDVKADISREMELDELRKLQTTMQDAAQSFERSVSTEINETESELQKIAEAEPISSRRDAQPQEQSPAATASDQLELGLDSSPPAPERKQG